MKFYYQPGACPIGIHVILEEIGKPYEAIHINLREGAQYKPDYTTISPKSKVPCLVTDDGQTITEYGAIASWLAKTNPSANLLPTDPMGQIRATEVMDYCVATIHMQGYTRMFRPANFSPNEADQEAVKARGREIIEKGYAILDKQLAGKDYILGAYSIADSALFYVEFWSKIMNITLPPNLAAHFGRMIARPAVQRVMKAEGLDQAA